MNAGIELVTRALLRTARSARAARPNASDGLRAVDATARHCNSPEQQLAGRMRPPLYPPGETSHEHLRAVLPRPGACGRPPACSAPHAADVTLRFRSFCRRANGVQRWRSNRGPRRSRRAAGDQGAVFLSVQLGGKPPELFDPGQGRCRRPTRTVPGQHAGALPARPRLRAAAQHRQRPSQPARVPGVRRSTRWTSSRTSS